MDETCYYLLSFHGVLKEKDLLKILHLFKKMNNPRAKNVLLIIEDDMDARTYLMYVLAFEDMTQQHKEVITQVYAMTSDGYEIPSELSHKLFRVVEDKFVGTASLRALDRMCPMNVDRVILVPTEGSLRQPPQDYDWRKSYPDMFA